MADLIDIKGLDKAAVLAVLYNQARPQGMGFMHYDPKPMTVEEAKAILSRGNFDFDYLKGRVMKVDLEEDTFDPRLYDRDNGQGTAQQVIDSLKTTQDTNNILIRAQHVEATLKEANDTASHLQDQATPVEGDTAVLTMGFSDVADILGPKVKEAEETLKSPLD